MLKIYAVILDLIAQLKPYMQHIERNDSNLASQMRRACSSIALNCGEGAGAQGRNKRARYFTALGSAREVKACLDVAHVLGYIDSVDPARSTTSTTSRERSASSLDEPQSSLDEPHHAALA
jgi:four helix bundle protein